MCIQRSKLNKRDYWGIQLHHECGEKHGTGRQLRRALALLIAAVAAVVLILVYLFLVVWA